MGLLTHKLDPTFRKWCNYRYYIYVAYKYNAVIGLVTQFSCYTQISLFQDKWHYWCSHCHIRPPHPIPLWVILSLRASITATTRLLQLHAQYQATWLIVLAFTIHQCSHEHWKAQLSKYPYQLMPRTASSRQVVNLLHRVAKVHNYDVKYLIVIALMLNSN